MNDLTGIFHVDFPVGDAFSGAATDLREVYGDPEAYMPGYEPMPVFDLYPKGSTLEQRVQMRISRQNVSPAARVA